MAATATADAFDQALRFERTLTSLAVERVERMPYGWALLDPARPLVHSANTLWVRAFATADALVADADRLFAAPCYRHRQILIEREQLWRQLDAAFAQLDGWTAQTHRYMVHAGAPDRSVDLDDVVEVDAAAVAAAERRYLATTSWARDDPRVRDQLIAHWQRIGAAGRERAFAIRADGAVVAFAKLRRRGAIAQVEDVLVLEAYRGRGFGRRVTWAAASAALRDGARTLFLIAADDDWPQELYARLGFTAVGRVRLFERLPPS